MMNKKIVLGILENNIVGESPFLAEHGISILIQIREGEREEIHLLDCGKSSSTLLHNLEAYGIDLANLSLQTIVLSHGHYDHTGGLKGLLEKISQPKPIPIIGHTDIFIPRITYVGGIRSISCPFTQSEIRQAGGELLLTRDPVTINDFLMTTGEVPRRNQFEVNPFFRKICNDQWVADEVDDDLSLIIQVNRESFFLLCGCCHAGLVNTLEKVKELTGKEKCYGIMGGLHLIGASRERINFTITELKKWKPEMIIPLHCSGREAMCELRNHFPENTKLLNCGDSFSLQIE
jgi:7,8-dihydropterin-6-yl-methyl-4-(beta-D-ribofuranosyl)aminobenzene 5'-phosphate synthase